MTWSIDILFDLHLNKRVRKQWWRQWFESQRLHHGVTLMEIVIETVMIYKWMKTLGIVDTFLPLQ